VQQSPRVRRSLKRNCHPVFQSVFLFHVSRTDSSVQQSDDRSVAGNVVNTYIRTYTAARNVIVRLVRKFGGRAKNARLAVVLYCRNFIDRGSGTLIGHRVARRSGYDGVRAFCRDVPTILRRRSDPQKTSLVPIT